MTKTFTLLTDKESAPSKPEIYSTILIKAFGRFQAFTRFMAEAPGCT